MDVSQFHEETAVTFSQLSDELLWQYIDSGEPMCVSQHPEAAAPPAPPPRYDTPGAWPGVACHRMGLGDPAGSGRRQARGLCVLVGVAMGRPPQPAARASGVAAP